MKKAGVNESGEMTWIDVPDPVAPDGYAVVETTVVPICTEYKYFFDGIAMARVGHEAVGVVVAAAPGSARSEGDRVVVMPTWPCGLCGFCRQGAYVHCSDPRFPWDDEAYTTGADTFAEKLIKPDRLLVPIPDDLSDEMASMTLCGLGPTFGAMQTLQVDDSMTVLITGLGPVGLGGVVNAIDRGSRVIAVEPNPYRRELGRELGAVVLDGGVGTVESLKELTGGLGPDVAVDCTGITAGRRIALEAIRSLGTVAFVGEGGDLTVHVSDELIRTGKRLLGSWHYRLGDAPALFDVVRRQIPRLETVITHRFPLERFREAWDTQNTGQTGKVLLTR